MEQNALSALDARGYTVLDALAHGGLGRTTHAAPNTFVCSDGKTYWVKGRAQQGLVAELIAGRLADKVGAGPSARVIRVPHESLPPGGAADHLEGVVVGLEDVPNTVNARELEAILGPGNLPPTGIDGRSRAIVFAFQTWIGVGDTQVLVGLADGRIYSIDHGECFSATSSPTDPSPIVAGIPGLTEDIKKHPGFIRTGIERIERLTENDLLFAIAHVPVGGPWQSPADRRLGIANWLAYRRGKLREVIELWLKS
jgi:hypothetical protein